jgi:DNA repair exonuclease SbcCD ATPase subunit
LQSLCNKQNQLNQTTKQCNNPSNQCDNPSLNPNGVPQFRQELQRLAGEQGSIRKSLEELNAEFGNSRQILGRLDDIAKEMKQVEEDLADGEIGEETTQRQLRIYSRMLQAARSLQRKDFSEQRRATTAEDQPYFVPPSLPTDIFSDRVNLEDRLRRFLGDNYPPQYEEQIKAYFKALLQAESALNNLNQPAKLPPQ